MEELVDGTYLNETLAFVVELPQVMLELHVVLEQLEEVGVLEEFFVVNRWHLFILRDRVD